MGQTNGEDDKVQREPQYSQLPKNGRSCDAAGHQQHQNPIKTTLSPAVQRTVQNVSLVYLTILQTLSPLMVRQCHKMANGMGQPFLSSTVVLNTEVAKLSMSCLILLISHRSITRFCSEMSSAFLKNKKETVKVCVPALIYVVQNNLYYFALKRVPATLFSITYQLRILATALLSMLLLRRVFSRLQWGALCISVLGVCLVQLSSAGAKSDEQKLADGQFVGLLATFVICWTSAFAGVYLEGVLKQSSCDIWTQNIRLSVITLPFALITVANDAKNIQKNGLLAGWTWLLWVNMLSAATSGFVVAAVMKYADNIKKSYCQSIALGGTALLSILTGDSEFSIILLIGVGFVIASVFIYTLNPPKAKARTPEPRENLGMEEDEEEEDEEEKSEEGARLRLREPEEPEAMADEIIKSHKSTRSMDNETNGGGNKNDEEEGERRRRTMTDKGPEMMNKMMMKEKFGQKMPKSVSRKRLVHLRCPSIQPSGNVAQRVAVS